MNQIPLTPQIVEVARRVIWFEEPSQAVTNPIRFMTYAMTYATHEDMAILQQYVSDEDLRQTLEKAPPGIFDKRSWAYWHLKLGLGPAPAMPQRQCF